MCVWRHIQGSRVRSRSGPILSWRLIMKWFLRSFPSFRWFIQEGLLSVTSESMCTYYWLTACPSLPRKKCGKVNWSSRNDHSCWLGTQSNKTNQPNILGWLFLTSYHLLWGQGICHPFWRLFLNQRKENDHRNYFMINLHKRMEHDNVFFSSP